MATRLLVVDDATDDRTWLAAALRARGHEVVEAGDGEEGLARLGDGPVDLVLCELAMADATGRSLLERIALDRPEVPVVVVTVESERSDVVQALRLGAADYLFKPVADPAMVVHAVDAALERTRLRRDKARVEQELELANQRLRDHVEALQRDQRAGRQVQFGMLPPSPMAIDGFRLQHRIVPSLYLSGDFVDYFRVTEQHFVLYIADVSGHGASSAFVTVLLKNFSRRLRREYRPRMLTEPGDILRWLNQELLESHLDRHVTMFLGVVDCARQRLAYANAGHFPAPVLASEEGARFLELPGKPLGLFPELRFASATVELPERCTLALFSDGVLEVLPEPELAQREQRLLHAVERSGTNLDGLCSELGLSSELEAPDDIACLLVTRAG
jgi:serine phosphatase RsbU (regulator of sigma subunit)